MESHMITRSHLHGLMKPLSRESAHSTLLVLDKVVHVASSSLGVKIRLTLFIRRRNDGERYYGNKIEAKIYGRDPIRGWYRRNHTMGTEALYSSIESELRGYRDKVSVHRKGAALGSMLEAFSLISTTLVECESCTHLVLPIKDLRVRPEDAEKRVGI